ncbi:MAG TPA: hypothetical protein VHL30_00210 [Chlamydiales bacterium]|jgi:hypothetical protein|nr:hypothetical protein [Chlamydiales bacterium]
MRKFYFIIACIFGGALTAETIGNVEFEFPPSTSDWVLLTDSNAYCPVEENSGDTIQIKIYTHKVGDALEFFTVANILEQEEEEETEEEKFQTAEYAQRFVNDLLAAYFPNHRIAFTAFTEDENDGFLEWELNDGMQQIFYGLCRSLKVKEGAIVLSYMTTASKTLENSAVWREALYQAKPQQASN